MLKSRVNYVIIIPISVSLSSNNVFAERFLLIDGPKFYNALSTYVHSQSTNIRLIPKDCSWHCRNWNDIISELTLQIHPVYPVSPNLMAGQCKSL